MTVADIVAKRKRIWENRHDIQYDAEYVKIVAEEITHIDNQKLRDEIQKKPYLLIETTFTVVDKDKKTVPFFLNDVQRDFIKQLEQYGTSKPYFILKGRQQGFTSLITAIQLAFSIVRKNFAGFTLADNDDNARAIFRDKAKAVFDLLPAKIKPTIKTDSMREYYFDKLKSSWEVAPATENKGRSRTPIFLHMSECAFYKSLSGLEKGILQAMPKNSYIIYETTANGFNEAKTLWDSESCINLFYEWWKTSEYTENDISLLDTTDDWLKERVKWLKEIGISDKQIAWYCKKFNGYIDKDSIKQEYPCSAHEAFISSGNCVFDKEAVIKRLEQLKPPIKQGYFEYDYDGLKISNIHWVDDVNGLIKIYKEVEERHKYVIGGDTSGEGSDYFSNNVLDNTSGEQVAVLRQKLDEDYYVRQTYCLGMYYNESLIGIESNFSTYPNKELARIGYNKLYIREKEDSYEGKIKPSYGFRTDQITRPLIIAGLVPIIRDNTYLINDKTTLQEALTFIKNNGRPEAQEGCNDDTIMSLAISYYIRPQQSFDIEPLPESLVQWTADMWEDYYNANEDAKKYLINKWGRPA